MLVCIKNFFFRLKMFPFSPRYEDGQAGRKKLSLLSADDHCCVFLQSQTGDQIGRLFASWALVYFQKSCNFFGLLFPTVPVTYVLILTKNGLGFILGDFFHKLIWSPWSHSKSNAVPQAASVNTIIFTIPRIFVRSVPDYFPGNGKFCQVPNSQSTCQIFANNGDGEIFSQGEQKFFSAGKKMMFDNLKIFPRTFSYTFCWNDSSTDLHSFKVYFCFRFLKFF
jgi:hypothetical protein